MLFLLYKSLIINRILPNTIHLFPHSPKHPLSTNLSITYPTTNLPKHPNAKHHSIAPRRREHPHSEVTSKTARTDERGRRRGYGRGQGTAMDRGGGGLWTGAAGGDGRGRCGASGRERRRLRMGAAASDGRGGVGRWAETAGGSIGYRIDNIEPVAAFHRISTESLSRG